MGRHAHEYRLLPRPAHKAVVAGVAVAVLGGASAAGVAGFGEREAVTAAEAADTASDTASVPGASDRDRERSSRSGARESLATPQPSREAQSPQAVAAEAAAAEAAAAEAAAVEAAAAESARLAAEAAAQAAAAPPAAPEPPPAPEPVPGGTPASNRDLARSMSSELGWGGEQWECLDLLWQQESSWDHLAENPSSGAYGIPQSLPASKMASHGDDWASNPATQISWGLDYIDDRYGTPCSAWSFHLDNNWY